MSKEVIRDAKLLVENTDLVPEEGELWDRTYAREVSRLRREFMCQTAMRLMAMTPFGDCHDGFTGYSEKESFDLAESALLEAQRRGILP